MTRTHGPLQRRYIVRGTLSPYATMEDLVMRVVTAAWRKWQIPRRATDEPGREPEQRPAERRPMQLLLHTSTWLVWRDDEGRIIYVRQ